MSAEVVFPFAQHCEHLQAVLQRLPGLSAGLLLHCRFAAAHEGVGGFLQPQLGGQRGQTHGDLLLIQQLTQLYLVIVRLYCQRKLEIVSCPSCGRAQVDVYTLAEKVQAGLQGMTVPLRVAVMGCVVNGPGEAREADLGVASGNGKGQIFVKGEVIKTVPESQIVETLIEEAMRLAEEMEAAGVASGAPTVTTA